MKSILGAMRDARRTGGIAAGLRAARSLGRRRSVGGRGG